MSILAPLKLNPEPTDVQLALFKRHKQAGTSPGNPKWYKSLVVKPFEFKGGPAKYPPIPTGLQWNIKHGRQKARRHHSIVTYYKDGTYQTRKFK